MNFKVLLCSTSKEEYNKLERIGGLSTKDKRGLSTKDKRGLSTCALSGHPHREIAILGHAVSQIVSTWWLLIHHRHHCHNNATRTNHSNTHK